MCSHSQSRAHCVVLQCELCILQLDASLVSHASAHCSLLAGKVANSSGPFSFCSRYNIFRKAARKKKDLVYLEGGAFVGGANADFKRAEGRMCIDSFESCVT